MTSSRAPPAVADLPKIIIRGGFRLGPGSS
jgi:hypothetical protein